MSLNMQRFGQTTFGHDNMGPVNLWFEKQLTGLEEYADEEVRVAEEFRNGRSGAARAGRFCLRADYQHAVARYEVRSGHGSVRLHGLERHPRPRKFSKFRRVEYAAIDRSNTLIQDAAFKGKLVTSYRDINDEEWRRIAHLLPELRPRSESRGRPLTDTRDVLNGVLWTIFSGGTWSSMPRKYPAYQTCHRRFKVWHQSGILTCLLEELYGAASRDLSKAMQSRMRKKVVHAQKR